MSTALTVVEPRALSYGDMLRPRSLDEALKLAEMLARSEMVPKDYKGKAGNIIAAVQMGAELGLAPMQALQNIAVINGRPSVWGDALLALCQAHPDFEWIQETSDGGGDSKRAICELKRRNNPLPTRCTFSVADAKKANLWGKQGPWSQYPDRMLKLRARGFACRDAFADALRGLASAEEAQDIPADRAHVVTQPAEYAEQPRQVATTTLKEVLAGIDSAMTEDELRIVAPSAERLSPTDKAKAKIAYKKRGNELRQAAVAVEQEREPGSDDEPPHDAETGEVSPADAMPAWDDAPRTVEKRAPQPASYRLRR